MRPLRTSVTTTAVFAVLAAAAAWAIGVNWVQSLLVAMVVATVGAGSTIAPWLADDLTWPRRRPDPVGGTRREVTGLSWTLSPTRREVSPAAIDRLRAVATHRLARHGIDLADPAHATAAVGLLGTSAYDVLIVDPSQPVRASAFAAAVTAVERLDTRPATHTSGRRSGR